MSFRQVNKITKRVTASQKKDYKKVYFIACEGRRTEVDYFNSIEENKKSKFINIDETIHIEAMSQEYNNALDLLECLKNKRVQEDLDDYELCLVVDRDYKSFIGKQFETVLKGCEEHKINLGISNPCFEIWLLLHFSSCKKDKTKLWNNVNDYIGKQITEEIKKINPTFQKYNKNGIKNQFDYYLPRIENAIVNSTNHEINNKSLRKQFGTSVGELMKKILSHKK